MTTFRDRIKGLARLPGERSEAAPLNPRTHDEKQRGALRGLLTELGVIAAGVVWVPDKGARAKLRKVTSPEAFAKWLAAFEGIVQLVDGHLRREELAAQDVPVLVTDLDAQEAKLALATFDPVGELAGRDLDRLRVLLGGVEAKEAGTVDLLAGLRRLLPASAPPDDEKEPVIPTDALVVKWGTAPGQLWVVPSLTVPGREHRLLCGDCRKAKDVARLFGGARCNIAFTSPPYASQRKYDPDSGFRPIPPDDYVDWFEPVQANVRSVLAPDGSWFVNIKEHCEDGERHLYVKDLTIAHKRRWGWRFVDEIAWHKTAVPGSWPNRFRNAWEPVFQFATTTALKFRPEHVRHASDRAVDGNGGSPKNAGGAWSIPDSWARVGGEANAENVIRLGTGGADSAHEAAFPLGLPAFFLRAYTDPGDAGFDPFLGSGTTIVAAEQTGRIGYGTEISARYVAVTLERLAVRGLQPRLVQ